MAEDCLKLNVFTPGPATGEVRQPVFLWLFPGGFLGGSAADFTAASEAVSAETGLVVVVPDVRLGVFGYLGSDRLRRNSTGNWGTLDTRLAWSWTLKHIHRFGGDPTRITMGGYSSGAATVSVLLSAAQPAGEPLHAALMMSGGFTDWAAFPLRTAESNYDAILRATGCHSSAACQEEGEPCRCLLAVPASDLVRVASSITWGPTVDGSVLSLHPMAALEAGKVLSVPIMIGSVLEDAFPVLGGNATNADFAAWLSKSLPAKAAREAYTMYLGHGQLSHLDPVHEGFSPGYWAARRAQADRHMTCPARRVARLWRGRAWQYFWDARFPGEATPGFGPGIAHTVDLQFLFQGRPLPEPWKRLAWSMQTGVMGLISGSGPGPAWPLGGGRGILFKPPEATAAVLQQEHCDFWDQWPVA